MTTSPGEAPLDRAPAPTSPAALCTAILNALDSAVLACDQQGRVLYANPAAQSVLESAPGETVDVRELVALVDLDGSPLPRERHPLPRALAGETLRGEECAIRDGDGACLPHTVSAAPLPGAQSAVIALTPLRESESEARLRTYVSDFEILTEVSRLLADVQDAEEAASIISTAAIGLTGAIAVLLWEVQAEDLILRGQEGLVGGEELQSLTAQARHDAADAIADRQTLVAHPTEADRQFAVENGSLPTGTRWHEPLTAGGRVTGALSIVWPGVLTDLERPGWLIEALAHHAATALERADLVRRLNAAARTDPLTGLANRRVWNERLHLELARAERESGPLSLVLIDIDHFKSYNDRFGHPQGDALLAAAASAWSNQLRTTDLLARVGGEEFAVLLPACPLPDACVVAERLRSVMPFNQTCSLGVAEWDGVANPTQFYAIADAALYQAKASGRDQVQIGSQVGGEGVWLAP